MFFRQGEPGPLAGAGRTTADQRKRNSGGVAKNDGIEAASPVTKPGSTSPSLGVRYPKESLRP